MLGISILLYYRTFPTRKTFKSQQFASNNGTQSTLNLNEVVNITQNATEIRSPQDLIKENITKNATEICSPLDLTMENITKNATERTPMQDLIMENVTRILSGPREFNRTLIDDFRLVMGALLSLMQILTMYSIQYEKV